MCPRALHSLRLSLNHRGAFQWNQKSRSDAPSTREQEGITCLCYLVCNKGVRLSSTLRLHPSSWYCGLWIAGASSLGSAGPRARTPASREEKILPSSPLHFAPLPLRFQRYRSRIGSRVGFPASVGTCFVLQSCTCSASSRSLCAERQEVETVLAELWDTIEQGSQPSTFGSLQCQLTELIT